MTRYSILLTTGTTGTIDTEQHLEEGMEVVITLHDENGNRTQETGLIAEILEAVPRKFD